jgi:hypothetical protein
MVYWWLSQRDAPGTAARQRFRFATVRGGNAGKGYSRQWGGRVLTGRGGMPVRRSTTWRHAGGVLPGMVHQLKCECIDKFICVPGIWADGERRSKNPTEREFRELDYLE